MLTLYQAEWCPACHRVRQLLTELGLTYTAVNVAAGRDDRADVFNVSGQTVIPVLQDGATVLQGSDAIVEHLRTTYEPAPDAQVHAAKAARRRSAVLPLPPADAVERLKEVLADEGFTVLIESEAQAISPHLPADLYLLYAMVPSAAAKALQLDPTAPSAAAIPISVFAADGGSRITAVDPIALVWLFREPPLTKLQHSLRDRLDKVFAKL